MTSAVETDFVVDERARDERGRTVREKRPADVPYRYPRGTIYRTCSSNAKINYLLTLTQSRRGTAKREGRCLRSDRIIRDCFVRVVRHRE